jgi:phosphoglycerol transferase MdoB-like AlkP superfamily enzyme
MFQSYFASPVLILLNLLPPLLIILALYFATGRAWIAFSAGAGITLFVSVVDFYKLQLRGDPLMAEDFAVAVEAGKMLGRYHPKLLLPVTLTIIFWAAGLLWTVFVCRHRLVGAVKRILPASMAAVILFGLCSTVYLDNRTYNRTVGDYPNYWPTAGESFVMRGFMYPFIHSLRTAFPSPPEGYSDRAAQEILAGYPSDDIPADKRVNVISVMLEAFCDLSEFPGVIFNTDVYEKWRALKEESVSGHLVNNIFGGGTIDTERLFLTGNTKLTDIRGATESYVYYFRDNGYRAEGFHTGDSWYYNRKTVTRDIGFNDYYFLEDFADANRSDEFFFKTLTELYSARDKSMPYFNHSLTYQNHGGYDDASSPEPYLIRGEGISDAAFNIVNNYLHGIYDTNGRIWEFVEGLRYDTEPVVLLFYGDHKPWLGDGELAYRELGINISTASGDGLYNLYTTPYVIWANDRAKELLSSDFTGDGGDFSPTFLMNKLFALAGWGGDEYMKAANAVFFQTPVVNSRTETTEPLSRLNIAEYYRRKHLQHGELLVAD